MGVVAGVVPRPLTRFVGREPQIAEVRALLARDDVRLLTLTGPGGVGKTRLALKVIEDASGYPGGVWFVALDSLRDPALVTPTIVRAIGAEQNASRSATQNIVAHIGDRRTLLSLDNFEQVSDAGVSVAHLLSSCPNLKVVVTSRVNLRISGEHVYAVPPLALPGDDEATDLALIQRCDSIRLFVDRARAIRSGFDLASHNASSVMAICRRLDGLPLAIELAAARVNALSPADILARLNTQLLLLTDGARDQPRRLQSLHASIAWSYDLLTPDEQALFRRLAVFAGPWALDDAAAVVRADDDRQEPSVVDGVTSLIRKNLIRQQIRPDGTSQYVMVETIRTFALQQLEAIGDSDRVWNLHATACLALATKGEAHLVHNVEPAWLDRLEASHENFRRALAWTFRPGQPTSATSCGVRLAGALWLFWYYHGHLTEGRRWLELALSASNDVPDSARAKVLLGLGTLLHYQGEKSRARMRLVEGLALSQRLDDQWTTAYLMTACGNLAEDEGKYDEASLHFSDANVLFSSVGDHVNVAVTLYHLGVVAFGQGNLELALAQCQNALNLSRSSNDPWTTAASLSYLGLIWSALGKFENAASALKEALTNYRRIESPERIAEVLSRTAILAQARGRPDAAIQLFAAAESIGERIGVHQELPELTSYARAISMIREAYPSEDFAAKWAAGRGSSMSEAIAVAERELTNGTSRATALLSGSRSASEPAALAAGLSSREIEVLRLLVSGKTDQQIADILFISRRTVATHLSHIYGKLGISSRTAAAAFAARHGLA